ncbi:hypothetical protein GUITHDRAFT_108397 [Guillardia theta CCMP2712]|uniref:Uncharacterized protein n=1 Tax=Guillardia theta (strain CCMP2712) TaxID=905079 RepID=L1JAF0_GUITC|nr:hypothetical protein GUITHDRAFT_108397 [Guillardia theta CCMP2712]EKX45523.1 hypothetical protein GUITHDRAFT_108397 [Guillardia theta CCMP2712]|eukprot:XP_005832503.1 hypothetical protein GUITHDRAFT_108397 [Guillardia theta CCMP2712]
MAGRTVALARNVVTPALLEPGRGFLLRWGLLGGSKENSPTVANQARLSRGSLYFFCIDLGIRKPCLHLLAGFPFFV